MSKAYCTCTSNRFMGLKPTTATNDICDKCGYYAVYVSSHEIFPHALINNKAAISGYRPLLRKPDTWVKAGFTETMMNEAIS